MSLSGAPDDYSDFFAELFSRMGAGGTRHTSGTGAHGARGDFRGEDHHAKVVLDLEDAFHGAKRQITLRSPQIDAQGRVTLQSRTLDVRIPVGVKPGQLIRLSGQGGAGHGAGTAGDLFLEVHFKPHARFQLDGANLLTDLPVAPWEAALGAVVPVELPGGAVLKVRVPEGAQAGKTLRVRGKGLPGASPGDLTLRVKVMLPSALDPRARKLYEQMAADLTDFDARKLALADTPQE